MDLKHLP